MLDALLVYTLYIAFFKCRTLKLYEALAFKPVTVYDVVPADTVVTNVEVVLLYISVVAVASPLVHESDICAVVDDPAYAGVADRLDGAADGPAGAAAPLNPRPNPLPEPPPVVPNNGVIY